METKAFLFMGRPGSGKGTQAKLLSEKTGYQVFSTGGKLRELAAEGTYIGQRAKEVFDQGLLNPYWLATYLFQDALFKLNPEDGIIFEGAGRKEPEARLFDEILTWLRRPYTVFYIDVSEESITERIKKRHGIEGRGDDDAEKIGKRLQEYNENTLPALNFFRTTGKVIDINGEPSPEEIHQEILHKLSLA